MYPFVISISDLYHVAIKRIAFLAIQRTHFANGLRKRDNLLFAEHGTPAIFAKRTLRASDT